MNRQK